MPTKHTALLLAAALLALACSGDATAPVPPPNEAPVATGEMPAQRLAGPGDTLSVDMAAYFEDPDGDPLTFAAASSDTSVVRVAVNGAVASLAGGSAGGGGAVTVTASDPSGLAAAASFAVAVNRAPAASGEMPTQSLVTEGAPVELDVSGYFQDPDGDVLSFVAASSDTSVVRVAVNGTVARLAAQAVGEAAVTVTARDPDGLEARAVFAVAAEHPDRVALAALYNATGGPNWTGNDGWLTDAPLGEWHGVTVSDGRVVGLSLVRNELTGQIPPELGYLASLRELELAINPLTGSIPPELGGLASLERLTLSANDLSGPIPPELGNLASLELLNLYGNGGRWADNDGDGLTGPIPPELGNLASLESLSLSSNELTGPIPPELDNLASLKELWLSDNDLSGPIPLALGGLLSMEKLGLSRNDLTGSIPPELGNLASLKELWLSDNELTGPIPPELGNLASLERLGLSDNDLSGPIPPELVNLASLELLGGLLLFPGNTGLCAPNDPPLLVWLKQFRDIPGAVGEPIAFPCDSYDRAALVALYDATDGPNWTDNGGWLTDAPLSEWHGVTVRDGWVEGLYLASNALTGPIPPELGGLASLKVLWLHMNELTGPIPPELGNLASLERLRLDHDTGLCAPDDFRLRAVLAKALAITFPCPNPGVRLLPSALMRADGNGLSLWLPDGFRAPAAVNVSDPAVVAADAATGWLELAPRGLGTADVEVVPAGGGTPAVASVVVREGVGTFGIDIVVTQPAPVGYAEAMTAAADWWSSALDGTEWTDRPVSCLGGSKATADELVIFADNVALEWPSWPPPMATASLCPGGGIVTLNKGVGWPGSVDLMRHEIGHLLGLVGLRNHRPLPDGSGLKYRGYWIGPRAVEAYRTGGGDPDLPGVPMDGPHWDLSCRELMSPCIAVSTVTGLPQKQTDGLSLAALADMGYTVDMTKATWGRNAAATMGERFRDVVTVQIGPDVPRR